MLVPTPLNSLLWQNDFSCKLKKQHLQLEMSSYEPTPAPCTYSRVGRRKDLGVDNCFSELTGTCSDSLASYAWYPTKSSLKQFSSRGGKMPLEFFIFF